jgi:hypothetical protein
VQADEQFSENLERLLIASQYVRFELGPHGDFADCFPKPSPRFKHEPTAINPLWPAFAIEVPR